MRLPCFIQSAFRRLLVGVLLAGSVACQKNENSATKASPPPGVEARELSVNRLGQMPGALYRAQADSPIHWQPWTPETLARTEAAKRLIFGVIVIPQQPGFQAILNDLAADPKLRAILHENYVPVLIDGDASREMGLLTSVLCAEIKRRLQVPLFVWMTPEGNPVAWIPVSHSPSVKVADLFYQSHEVVSRTWAEDPDYVLKNSATQNANRRGRMMQQRTKELLSEEPAHDVVAALRQLVSCYDTFSRTFDGAGGLFPAGALEWLASAGIHPGVPIELQLKCRETVQNLLTDLLPSPMFDPLDGGVFSSRVGTSWTLPGFYRDCSSQARIGGALLSGYRATGDPKALAKALRVISFSEKSYLTREGLFATGLAVESNPAAWLWTVEDIEKALPVAEATWWIKATGMKGLGNLAPDVDLRKEYFRGNTLGLGQSVSELAAEYDQPVDVFQGRFDTAREKLLNVRNSRFGKMVTDDSPHAGASFRMVSLYAAAFAVTGDLQFRDKAVQLLENCQATFSAGPKLRMFSQTTAPSLAAGRAFLYGLAMQAALDVAAITFDERWLAWSEELATTAAEQFTGNGFIKECPDEAKILDLPLSDRVMLFDDSSVGLISLAECRLAQADRAMLPAFSALATPLPAAAVVLPILYTDLLQAALSRQLKVVVIMGADLPAAMKLAIAQLPPRMIQRRVAKKSDEVPAGAVKVILGNKAPRIVTDLASLQQAVLPSTKK